MRPLERNVDESSRRARQSATRPDGWAPDRALYVQSGPDENGCPRSRRDLVSDPKNRRNSSAPTASASNPILSSAGRARRQFIGSTALAAIGGSAAALTRSLPAQAADSGGDAPGECPAVPTPMK